MAPVGGSGRLLGRSCGIARVVAGAKQEESSILYKLDLHAATYHAFDCARSGGEHEYKMNAKDDGG